MTSLIPSEAAEQVAFVQWLDLKGLECWHTPNSTFTKSWKQKAKNKALGVKAGIPDLFVVIPIKPALDGVDSRLIGVEMKRQKGGSVSTSQKYWIDALNKSGIETAVCKGADEAIKFVEERL